MDVLSYFTIGYIIVGLILTYIWWEDEYKPQYEEMKDNDEEVEEPMAVLLLLLLVFGWPIKVVLNRFY